MANLPSLSTDPSKINPAGAEPSDIEEYQKSLADQIYQLEQRYAQPNWFKIASGFAKPQLGGFLASLGSAAEAQGENVEQQRAMGLPIAQMRTQLAQSKIAMGQNKKAADLLTEHKGPITEDLVKELVRLAPDAPSTKAAQYQLETSRKSQDQALALLNSKYQSGAITKSQWADSLSRLQENTALGTVPKTKTNELQTLPNGVRVNEDGARLAELGIPIISGIRTREQQQALYDNRANNPNPVATPGTSQHETGNAYDIDTKSLSAEQRGMLKALGYKQPMPDKDPNHWEKVGARVEKQVLTLEDLGVTGSGESELSKEELKKRSENYNKLEQKIMMFDPESTSTAHSRHDRLAELLGTPGVQKGTGLLYKDQGITSAILSSLAQGASASISTPAGGAGFSLAFPVENAMTKANLKPNEQKQLREFQMLLRDEASDDLRKGVSSIGGGHLNQAEFSSVMNQIASGSDPYGILKGHVATRSAINDRNGEVYNLYGDWIHSSNNAKKPISAFFHSQKYIDIMKKYEPKIKQAKRLAD